MATIIDKKYRDPHFIQQGDFVIAVNESCAVIGNGKDRRVNVSFFSYRWNVLDVDRAKMNAELLKTRLDDMHRSAVTEHTLVELAAVCLDHYRIGEEQGWLEEIKPRYPHDCDDCIFLGPSTDTREVHPKDDRTTWSKATEIDLYYCPEQRPYPTVIARYGPDGPQYKSGLLFGQFELDPDLTEAYKRAISYGLLQGVRMPRINVIDQGEGQPPAWVRGEP